MKNTMKRTLTIPISITADMHNKPMKFDVSVADTARAVAHVELTHPGVNQFGAVVRSARVDEAVEYSPEEFNDVDDAVHYFAGRFFAEIIYGIDQ